MELVYLFIVSILCFSLVRGDGCPPGLFGQSCDEPCGHCMGGNSQCHPETGICRDGCSSGYLGDTCQERCPQGSYGLGCTKTCSVRCKEQECDPVDGNCASVGCVSGYMGRYCSDECPAGTYGPGCANVCRCREGCKCDRVQGNCLKVGCKPTKPEKKPKIPSAKRPKRQAPQSSGSKPSGGSKVGTGKTGLMCSNMQDTFLQLKETLNKRVEVPVWPMHYLMIIASVIIVLVGVAQMVSDFRREMYVRKWERENILQPLQIRAKLEEEELKRKIADLEPGAEPEKKKCVIS